MKTKRNKSNLVDISGNATDFFSACEILNVPLTVEAVRAAFSTEKASGHETAHFAASRRQSQLGYEAVTTLDDKSTYTAPKKKATNRSGGTKLFVLTELGLPKSIFAWETVDVNNGRLNIGPHIDYAMECTFGIHFPDFVRYVHDRYVAKQGDQEIINSFIADFVEDDLFANLTTKAIFGMPFWQLITYLTKTFRGYAPEEYWRFHNDHSDARVGDKYLHNYVYSSILEEWVYGMVANAFSDSEINYRQ